MSGSLLNSMRNFELAMGHTHQCGNCRSTFLANEDTCPYCGSWLIHLLDNHQIDDDSDTDGAYWMEMDFDTGKIIYLYSGDLCPWPRQD